MIVRCLICFLTLSLTACVATRDVTIRNSSNIAVYYLIIYSPEKVKFTTQSGIKDALEHTYIQDSAVKNLSQVDPFKEVVVRDEGLITKRNMRMVTRFITVWILDTPEIDQLRLNPNDHVLYSKTISRRRGSSNLFIEYKPIDVK